MRARGTALDASLELIQIFHRRGSAIQPPVCASFFECSGPGSVAFHIAGRIGPHGEIEGILDLSVLSDVPVDVLHVRGRQWFDETCLYREHTVESSRPAERSAIRPGAGEPDWNHGRFVHDGLNVDLIELPGVMDIFAFEQLQQNVQTLIEHVCPYPEFWLFAEPLEL